MDTDTTARPQPSPRRVWQLTGMLAVAAVVLATPRFMADPHALRPDLAWALLLPLFALAEVAVIHLPAERSSHSHTLREIPAIAGLTFLAPQEYVVVYVVGAGLALALWTHQRGIKLVFNVSMFTLEAVLGSMAYHAVLAGTDPIAPRAWAAALVAVLLTDLISAAAVTAAISLTEGQLDTEVLREAMRSGVPAAVVNTCVALLVVTLVVARPSALPLLGVMTVLLVIGYRAYVSLARGHARTRQLYDFVRSTGQFAGLQDVAAAVLTEAAGLLRASAGQLVILDEKGAPARLLTLSEGSVSSTPADPESGSTAWWAPAMTGTCVLNADTGAHLGDQGIGPRDGLAVPLRGQQVTPSVLIVTDRTFEEETFSEEDLRFLEALAGHAAVTLDKAQAVERTRKLAEAQQHDALHDQLTDLPNRRAFKEAVEEAMRAGERGAVLLLDLDDFKDVNDTLGHSAGDHLLQVIGRRLVESGIGFVARLGGDEFGVLLLGAEATRPVHHARAVHALLSRAVSLLDVKVTTSASLGVAEFVGLGHSSEEILSRADVAMYAAKRAGSNVQVYRPEDSQAIARRLTLAAELPLALDGELLEVWFQPQAAPFGGEVTGFEALLRWRHPEFGMVPPPEIVAVAHRTGLIRMLTAYVIRHSLLARASWLETGRELDVSVNVTPRDLADPALVRQVDEALALTGTPPGALVLEITESDAMGDPERSLAVLRALADMGVQLSIDDFGTGYSSLAYLDQFPVHEVKIDQSFVRRLERDAGDSTIVRATVTLAHDLGLRVVAEGVENDLARNLIADMGCDLYQGFGLARPMPGEQVLRWLGQHEGLHTPRRKEGIVRLA